MTTSSNSHKTRVAVICGARSTEHEVSLISAYNIVNAIDTDTYDVFVIGIDKQGVWRQYDAKNFVDSPTDIRTIKLVDTPLSGRLTVTQCSNEFYDLDKGGSAAFACDVIFPAVLGNYAEDGTMQGLLRMMDVPFTTPDVIGSSVAMDKDVAYRLLRDAGLGVANFVTLRKNGPQQSYSSLNNALGSDVLFVKPANAGSSVGVSRVTDAEELSRALELAFKYDVKVIVQAAVIGREVEIGVIGNIGGQQTSVVGEIIEKVADDFYSYDNKYVHSSNVELVAPAVLSDSLYKEISEAAVSVCEALECEGFGRVDFFVTRDQEVIVNEINTMPGFTAISMFPRLWKESGVAYPELIDRLLQCAIERHAYRIAPIVTDAADVLKIAAEAKAKA
ncbi:D-alanine--D-alanine ligase A [compost metagenome]